MIRHLGALGMRCRAKINFVGRELGHEFDNCPHGCAGPSTVQESGPQRRGPSSGYLSAASSPGRHAALDSKIPGQNLAPEPKTQPLDLEVCAIWSPDTGLRHGFEGTPERFYLGHQNSSDKVESQGNIC